ncbi:hypothetical protein ACPESN_11365 [Stutzerimonas marianensis]|uniref:hypothetical protein n=1 Tax=Stutzerimonas marianensis TaxID=2929513 RepID=UPI003C2BF4FF
MMEKIYRSLKWLKMEQAVQYLEALTNTSLSESLLTQFGNQGKLDFYIDISLPGVEGVWGDPKERVKLYGIYKVLNPEMAFQDGAEACVVLLHNGQHWIGVIPRAFRTALLKSADIEALAALINQAPISAAEKRALDANDDEKPSSLLAVAGLLRLLLARDRPIYDQGRIAQTIDALGWHGASATSLNKLFSAANKAAKEADKVAQAKAEARAAAGGSEI